MCNGYCHAQSGYLVYPNPFRGVQDMNRVRVCFFVLLLALMAFIVTSSVLVAPAHASTPSSDDAAMETEDDDGTLLSPAEESEPARSAIVPLPIDDSGGFVPDPDGYLSEWVYEDASISVRIVKGRANETDYLVATIKVADPSQIRTAAAGKPNSQETAAGAVIAKRMNAVLAINTDYYSYRPNGYIVRQGVVCRQIPNTMDILFIDDRGDLHVVEYPTQQKVAEFLASLEEDGRRVVNSFEFGPLLVRDGKKVEEIHYFDIGTVKPTQRMGIAQIGPLEYLCVSTEGPEDPGSVGFTVEQFAELMESLGAEIAYNMDGGSSNTLVFNNMKINSPKNRKIRSIPDILYFATAVDLGI